MFSFGQWGLSPHLVPISVAEGPHLVPISIKNEVPIWSPFEKFRSPFHVGLVETERKGVPSISVGTRPSRDTASVCPWKYGRICQLRPCNGNFLNFQKHSSQLCNRPQRVVVFQFRVGQGRVVNSKVEQSSTLEQGSEEIPQANFQCQKWFLTTKKYHTYSINSS